MSRRPPSTIHDDPVTTSATPPGDAGTDAIAARIDPAPDPRGSTDVASGHSEPSEPQLSPSALVSPSAFMSAASGLVLVAWSATALVRTGVGRPLGTPIVEVGGFTTTAILGLIVLGAGAVLLLAAATRHRAVIGLAAGVVTAAAVALAIDPAFAEDALAAERDLAIAVAILSGITTLVAMLADDVVRADAAPPTDHHPAAGSTRRRVVAGTGWDRDGGRSEVRRSEVRRSDAGRSDGGAS